MGRESKLAQEKQGKATPRLLPLKVNGSGVARGTRNCGRRIASSAGFHSDDVKALVKTSPRELIKEKHTAPNQGRKVLNRVEDREKKEKKSNGWKAKSKSRQMAEWAVALKAAKKGEDDEGLNLESDERKRIKSKPRLKVHAQMNGLAQSNDSSHIR